MIQPKYTGLSIRAQCQLLNIHRSNYYYRSKGETTMNLDLMRKIDEISICSLLFMDLVRCGMS